jgi:hypothetical protein
MSSVGHAAVVVAFILASVALLQAALFHVTPDGETHKGPPGLVYCFT